MSYWRWRGHKRREMEKAFVERELNLVRLMRSTEQVEFDYLNERQTLVISILIPVSHQRPQPRSFPGSGGAYNSSLIVQRRNALRANDVYHPAQLLDLLT